MSAVACGFYEDPDAARLLKRASPVRRALFLDRDGVINVDHAYVHRSEDTDWMPGIFEVCRSAAESNCLLVVVTNQAGIARGYYDEDEFLRYTRWVHDQFKANGAPLCATYYCPHHPEVGEVRACECRKPAPGMILAAASRYGIALAESALIGDKASDIRAGKNAGIGLNLLLGRDAEGMADRSVLSLDIAGDILSAYFGEAGNGVDDVRK